MALLMSAFHLLPLTQSQSYSAIALRFICLAMLPCICKTHTTTTQSTVGTERILWLAIVAVYRYCRYHKLNKGIVAGGDKNCYD